MEKTLMFSDVRLRGCLFTLHWAADQNNAPPALMHDLLLSIYCKVEANNDPCDPSYEIMMPTTFSRQNFLILGGVKDALPSLLENKIVYELSENLYKISDFAMEVLYDAADQQNYLDSIGFSTFGCCVCC